MRRIAFIVAYDGTGYAGWQRQDTGLAIQQVLEDAIQKQFHETVHVMGSGRTDAGVHALGQVAAFDLQHPIPADKLLLALNANLPEDIRILKMWEAKGDFHPQYGAKRKTYGYCFVNGPILLPQLRTTAHLVPEPLNISAMKAMLALLEGEHDFAAFRSSGGQNLSTVREIYEARLIQEPIPGAPGEEMYPLYEIQVCGNGFLYNMVRIIAGTCFDVGRGKIGLSMVEEALRTGNRLLLGATAPAKGLTLLKVEYEK